MFFFKRNKKFKPKSVTKKYNIFSTIIKLIKFLYKGSGGLIILYFALMLISATIPILSSNLFARFLDSAILSVHVGRLLKQTLILIVFYGVLQIINSLFGISGSIINYIWLVIDKRLWKYFTVYRDNLVAKARKGILELPEIASEYKLLEDKMSPFDIIRTISNLVNIFSQFISLVMVAFVLLIKMPVIFIFGLTLGLLDTILAYIRTKESVYIGDASLNFIRRVNRSWWNINTFHRLLQTKSLGLVKFLVKHYGKDWFLGEELNLSRTKKWNLKIYVVRDIFYLFIHILTMAYLVLKAISKVITIGQITYYSSLSGQLRGYIGSIGNSLANISKNMYYLNRFFVFWEVTLPQKEQSMKSGTIVVNSLLNKDIKVKDLYFKYPNSKHYALKNLNLFLPAKGNIAIVGHNGAGKTTFLKLLLGHYINYKGNIKVGKIEVKDFEYSHYLSRFSILPQEIIKFNFATVVEAIRIDALSRQIVDKQVTKEDYDAYKLFKDKQEFEKFARNLEAGKYKDIYQEYFKDKNHVKVDKKVKQVLKQVGLYEFVNKLPNKYNTYLSPDFLGGVDLSMGQWQRLHIARILYAPGDILILDEPTSAIDPMASFKLIDTIFNTFKDRTVIIVSHRYSTIAKADIIYVFDKGRVVEFGSHKELISKNGVYSKAYKEEMRRLS